jgi:hypothetical protein
MSRKVTGPQIKMLKNSQNSNNIARENYGLRPGSRAGKGTELRKGDDA